MYTLILRKGSIKSIITNTLLQKLVNYGFSVSFVTLLKTYLENRLYIPRFSGNTPEKYDGNTGVPQGFNLDALLFTLFINYIASLNVYFLSIDYRVFRQ